MTSQQRDKIIKSIQVISIIMRKTSTVEGGPGGWTSNKDRRVELVATSRRVLSFPMGIITSDNCGAPGALVPRISGYCGHPQLLSQKPLFSHVHMSAIDLSLAMACTIQH